MTIRRAIIMIAAMLGALMPSAAQADTPPNPPVHPLYEPMCSANREWNKPTIRILRYDFPNINWDYNGSDHAVTLQLTTIYQHQLKSQHTTHGNVSAKFTIKVIDLNAAFDYTFNHENATTKTKQTTKTVTESVGKTYVVYDAVRYGKLGADHMRCSNDGRSTKKLGSTEAHSFTDEKIGTIVCTGTPYPKKGTVGYYLRGTHWCKP